MPTPTTRQCHRRWLRASALIGCLGATAIVVLQVWIGFFAPNQMAATRGLAILVICVGITASSTVVAIFLKLTEAPALAAALRYLLGENEPAAAERALKLVPTARAATKS